MASVTNVDGSNPGPNIVTIPDTVQAPVGNIWKIGSFTLALAPASVATDSLPTRMRSGICRSQRPLPSASTKALRAQDTAWELARLGKERWGDWAARRAAEARRAARWDHELLQTRSC